MYLSCLIRFIDKCIDYNWFSIVLSTQQASHLLLNLQSSFLPNMAVVFLVFTWSILQWERMKNVCQIKVSELATLDFSRQSAIVY